ncbi:site-specific integrase [Thioalkalivibrio sp. ALE11]|uniref:tyrosine-type recombinase/integrase n=1 Tax=Thioalkalivibrio sp. ALE11 TaxID=1265494 RepID=UPI00036F47B7|nr:site-specific integrase [Thioalkalivibrio sp. ALE11]
MPNLTEAGLAKLEPPDKGRRLIFDTHREAPKGFGVRINAGGKKSFVLRYQSREGKDRLLTIGEHGTWTVAAARKQAVELRREIDTGADILEERRTERKEPTLRDVLERYDTAHIRKLKSSESVRRTLEIYALPALGGSKIRDIRRREVIELVEGVAEEHPRAASLLLTYLKGLFGWAEDREIIEANPVATIRPRKVSKSMTPRQRERVLDDAEIRAFWNSSTDMHLLTDLALRLILVTGQRPGEVAGMRWDEIEGDVWTIPASRRGKTETAHFVPLTGTALEILEQARSELERLAKRRKRPASGHVFEARPGSPITTPALGRAVSRFRAELENWEADTWGHWTPHDLRRTCRTRLAAEGIPEAVAEAVIGHTRKGIVAVYDRHGYDVEKRAALKTWERRLLRIARGETGEDNVVSIHAGQATNG